MSTLLPLKRPSALPRAVGLLLCGVLTLAAGLGEESSPADKPLPFPEKGR